MADQLTIRATSGHVIGWIRKDCTGPNVHCKKASNEGRHVHAIPRVRGGELEDYHFSTFTDAYNALAPLAGEPIVRIHDLTRLTHAEAYDETQTNDAIKDGDVLLLSGGSVGFLNRAWPIILFGHTDALHRLHEGFTIDDIEDGRYQETSRVASEAWLAIDRVDYPDSPTGVHAYLADETDLKGISEAHCKPDPSIPGCWLVEGMSRTSSPDPLVPGSWLDEIDTWTTLVYVGSHPLAPSHEMVD